jgi:hypothetical protein
MVSTGDLVLASFVIVSLVAVCLYEVMLVARVHPEKASGRLVQQWYAVPYALVLIQSIETHKRYSAVPYRDVSASSVAMASVLFAVPFVSHLAIRQAWVWGLLSAILFNLQTLLSVIRMAPGTGRVAGTAVALFFYALASVTRRSDNHCVRSLSYLVYVLGAVTYIIPFIVPECAG